MCHLEPERDRQPQDPEHPPATRAGLVVRRREGVVQVDLPGAVTGTYGANAGLWPAIRELAGCPGRGSREDCHVGGDATKQRS